MSFDKGLISIPWKNMQKYDTQDIEFAEEARQLLSHALGFEPNIKASYHSEMRLRNSVKRHKSGDLTARQLQSHIDDACIIVHRVVYKEVSHQAHLVDLKKLDDHYGGRDEWVNL